MKYWLAFLTLAAGCHASPPPRIATPQEAITSKLDLWGEAALKQSGGPTFEFFDRLLPPIRYVDADFRNYPIVLSAPGAATKARLVSNGSAINDLARQPNWRNEAGVPVRVLVSSAREPFGDQVDHLDGPRFVDGAIPIVQVRYRASDGESYAQEAFASIDSKLSSVGAVLARFEFPRADGGRIELRFETGPVMIGGEKGGVLRQADGRILAAFDDNWNWNRYRSCLTSKAKHAKSAVVAIFTTAGQPDDLAALGVQIKQSTTTSRPVSDVQTDPPPGPPGEMQPPKFADELKVSLTGQIYDAQRAACAQEWEALLHRGTQIETPEAYVNQAARGLVVGSYMISVGDRLNYSAGNQYARQYVSECGDAVRSFLLLGHEEDASRFIVPLLQYSRSNMGFHNAGHKLQLLAGYYWVTRDADFIRQTRPIWQKEIDLIRANRQPPTGLLPKEKYCGDIDDIVNSLNSNAICWRGLRDMAAVLRDTGEREEGDALAIDAAARRKIILAAIDHAMVRTLDPPFLPVYEGEEVHDPITATRLGSYWNLISGYMLGSGVFRFDSQQASDVCRYLQTKGGLCMGMLRVQSARSFWVGDPPQNIDDLYGMRYALTLQQRDEPDRALVSFYGKLAQGMTRNTYEDGESTSIFPLDRFGRQVYLPPNSAANASFLQQLRGLLVQDWDMDDDGVPDTLRLTFATPRQWLEDGKRISVQRAPTAFGEVSFVLQSALKKGRVDADVTLPPRPPEKMMIRLRLPEGYRVTSASAGDQALRVIEGQTIDLSGLRGTVHVVAKVSR